MRDVTGWLESLGLGIHAGLFAEHDIDEEVVPELTDADLRELGLSLGHRRKLLKAIRELRGEAPAAQPPPAQPFAAPSPAAAGPRPEPAPAPEAERRQLTVMFCDLVGSTALSTRLDPEELRELMRAFQDRCAGAIARFDGFIARYMGDGLLVYFGFPRAHEDDAERAVRAGLDIVAAVGELDRDVGQPKGAKLSVRVGIATGLVVVGDIVGEGASAESAVVGETPNLAARLQGVAGADEVVIGKSTRALLADRFDLEALGARTLKGIDHAVEAWRVRGAPDTDVDSAARSGARARASLVGRQEELGLLLRAWESSRQGHGQVVLVSGEAGIGKSRLVDALRERLEGENHLWTPVRCSPYHAGSALHPVIEQVKRAIGHDAADGPGETLAKLERALEPFEFELAEVVPLIAALLSLPLPEGRYPPLTLTPARQRQLTLDALAGWLFEEAERRPVLQVWEDIHWADPSTLELLGLYIEQSPTAALLNVLTFRPDFAPPWAQRSHMTPITLARLEVPEVRAIVVNLSGGKALPEEVLAHIVDKADGVPLYVEELTRAIRESELVVEGADRFELRGSLGELRIPATLQDSLMSRLDREPAVRELAQLGAVLGREFAYGMLHTLAGIDDAALRDGLDRLVAAELLYQRGRPPRARYTFKHALIQDAAYHSLLNRSRQRFHRRVAELLESDFPELVAAQPELVAHHYAKGERPDSAVDYWARAGQRAAQRWATGEAASHFRTGLALLESLPASAARDARELDMQMALGPALVASRGFAEPAVEDVYARAAELCEALGDRPRAYLALRGRQIFHFSRGELEQSREYGTRLLALTESDENATVRVCGHHALGQSLFLLGELEAAKQVLDAGARLIDADPRSFENWPGGQPGEQCHLFGAFTSWMLGFPDAAVRHAERALAIAEMLGNQISLLNTQTFVALFHSMRGDAATTLRHAAVAVSLAREYRAPTFLAFAEALHGSAVAAQGRDAEGIAQMRRALDDQLAGAVKVFATPFLVELARALGRDGRTDEGFAALDEAEALVASNGEHVWDADRHRVRGELLLEASPDDPVPAEACFEQAITAARERAARWPELLAVTRLARSWSTRGRSREARELLAPLLDWFGEYDDAPDLRAARGLYESLT